VDSQRGLRVARRLADSVVALVRALGFIANHPLNRSNRAGSLARFFGWQVYKRLTGRAVTISVLNGFRLRVYPDNRMASAVLYTRLPEYDDMLFVARFLRGNDVFVDIGANVGSYSVIALAAAPDTRVVAFEPHPNTFDRLSENIELNGAAARARLRNCAVGDRQGTISFTMGEDAKNHIATDRDTLSVITVPLTTLDEELRGEGEVAIVKMDVEGAEALVLKGADGFIRESPPLAWIVELIDVGRRYGIENEDVVGMLGSYGYRPYEYRADEHELVAFDRGRASGNNAVFVADIARVRRRLAENGYPVSE
jgi:FkbM family methyltransferase